MSFLNRYHLITQKNLNNARALRAREAALMYNMGSTYANRKAAASNRFQFEKNLAARIGIQRSMAGNNYSNMLTYLSSGGNLNRVKHVMKMRENNRAREQEVARLRPIMAPFYKYKQPASLNYNTVKNYVVKLAAGNPKNNANVLKNLSNRQIANINQSLRWDRGKLVIYGGKLYNTQSGHVITSRKQLIDNLREWIVEGPNHYRNNENAIDPRGVSEEFNNNINSKSNTWTGANKPSTLKLGNLSSAATLIQRRFKTHRAREAFKRHWLVPGGGYHRFIAGNIGATGPNISTIAVPSVPQVLRSMANVGIRVAPTNAPSRNTNTGRKNTKQRTIWRGPKGGLYVLVNGRKTYKFTE